MKQTINFTDFTDAFKNYNRQEQFSYNGKKALFEYLEEYEESTGEEIELDVIALCCEYVEYDSLEEFWQDYDEEDFPHVEAIEWHTQFIPIDDDSFIIAAF
ncbi:hypothetical protein [uncultured Wocania sp.]|uniref:hypothetical protein n=1 Tax=uncultured Wocania sp. TaxID=2834404 RepID=UPI0030F52DE9